MAESLASLLSRIVKEHTGVTPPKSYFNSKTIPSISIRDYLIRALKSRCSLESLIIAIIYMDRYIEAVMHFPLCEYNVHKLFIVALSTAVKFNDDFMIDHVSFAKVGALNLSEFAEMEKSFLNTLKFNLRVDTAQFATYVRKLTAKTDLEGSRSQA